MPRILLPRAGGARLAALLFFVGLSSVSWSSVSAQDSVNLNRFHAAETVDDGFAMSNAGDFGHLRFGVQLHVDYSNDPLVFERELGDTSTELYSVVSDQLTGNLNVHLGLWERLVISLGIPVHFVLQGEDRPAGVLEGVPEPQGLGAGDLYLNLRARIWGERDDVFQLGAQVTLYAPTGGGAYRGDNFLSVHPELLLEFHAGAFRILANAGAYFRDEQVFQGDVQIGHELTFGLGVAVPLIGDFREPWDGHRLDLHIQAYGDTSFSNFFGREETFLEALAGLKFHHTSGFVAGLAGGTGLTRGFGSPDFRLIGTLGWAMPEEGPQVGDRDGDGIMDPDDACPDDPEDFDDFEDEDDCPDPDNDQDGILDVDDECPLEPEDVDQFEDRDGCPDPDNDQDGILDVDDECPLDPEDFDGFEDEDGCPDPDNDQDGVLDHDDNCPMEPGPVENQGCPDADRDEDGIVDRMDNCPDEPGPPENFGCPERQRVRITDDRLEILEKVFFRTNSDEIQSRSFPLLDNVATVLLSHPELTTIRIEGHTDSRGSHAHNMDLSQRRAESVMDYLLRQGVQPERLTARGFGPDQPIESNATRSGRAANRRVEFNLGSAAAEAGIETGNAGPGADTMDEGAIHTD